MMLWKRYDVITTVTKVAEVKKIGERKVDGFRKKLMIPESQISECSEYDAKSKICQWINTWIILC